MCWCRVQGLFAPRGGTRIHVFAENFKEMTADQETRIRYAVESYKKEAR